MCSTYTKKKKKEKPGAVNTVPSSARCICALGHICMYAHAWVLWVLWAVCAVCAHVCACVCVRTGGDAEGGQLPARHGPRCVCVCVCVYVCMCVCVYVCVHTNTPTRCALGAAEASPETCSLNQLHRASPTKQGTRLQEFGSFFLNLFCWSSLSFVYLSLLSFDHKHQPIIEY